MSRWAVVIPSPQETNILANPSFEKDTAGWTAVGATLSRVSTQQRRGVYALSIAPTSGVNDGAYAAVTTTVTPHGFAIDALGVAGVPYLIRWADSSGTLLGVATTFIGTGKWQRVWVGWNENSATTRRVYVSKNNHASTGTFYVDGAKVSAESAESTYFDGDTKGFYAGDYYWLGAPHASQSVRKAYIRHGGRIADFEMEFGFLVEGHMGFGLGKIANILLPLALVGGAVFQRQVPQERSAALVGSFTGSTEQDLQQKRQKAVTVLGPNAYGRDEPVMLLYRSGDWGSTQPYLEIPALYEGGLEGARNKGYTENAALQFTMYLPYVSKQGNSAATLSIRTTLTNANGGLLRRNKDGTWTTFGLGMSTGYILGAVEGPDRNIYIYGTFTNLGGIAAADYLARYNPITGAITGVGAASGPNGAVYKAIIGPDNNLYIGGAFDWVENSGFGGVAGVARWNFTTGAWDAYSGASAISPSFVTSIAFDDWGRLWAAGNYTNFNGVTNATGVTYTNVSTGVPFTWNAAGTGAAGGMVSDVISDRAGGVYVIGAMTGMGGVTGTAGFARWNASTSAWVSLAGGTSAVMGGDASLYGLLLAYGQDGSLYLADAPSGSGKAMSKWDGTRYIYTPDAPTSTFGNSTISADPLGRIIVGTNLTQGPLPNAFGGLAWNGDAWEYATDITFPTEKLRSIFTTSDGSTYYIWYLDAATYASGATTITNPSTVTGPVKITLTGGGRVYSIRNLSTGKGIYFNLLLMDREVATLTLSETGATFTSTYRGNLLGTIAPYSDLTTFGVIPGTNYIAAFVDLQTGTPLASIEIIETHAAIDGGSN